MTNRLRPLRRGLAACGVALGILAVLLLGVIASGLLSVNAAPVREPIETALTRLMGRKVEIAGAVRLTLSFHPSLVVHDVAIANPAGFPESRFGTISELRLDTELLPLLRQRLIVTELRGRGILLQLARGAGGRGNWIFEPAPRDPDADSQSRFQADWHHVVLEQAEVKFVQAGAVRSLQLDKVMLEGLNKESPQLTVQGQADPQIPIKAELGSAALNGLGKQDSWPFKAKVEAAHSTASISGTRLLTDAGPIVNLRLDVSTSDLNEIEALLGVQLPMNGPATLSGDLEFAPGLTTLRNLAGRFGSFKVMGDAGIDSRGARPFISGRLTVPQLDVRSAAALQPGNEEAPPTLAALYGAFQQADVHLNRLSEFDADLDLTIGSLVNSPGDVRELKARVRINDGQLNLPFTGVIAGAAVEGAVSASTKAGQPGFGLRLATRDAPFGGLALLLFDLPYVVGTVQNFEADLSSSGHTLAELVHDLEAHAKIQDANLSYGNYPGGRPVALDITRADISQARGQTLSASVRGSLRGKAFAGSLGADTLEHLLRERQTPFHFAGSSGGIRLDLAGTLAEPAADSGPDIEVELTAPQARELAPWLGFSSQSTSEVVLSGRVQVRENGVKLGAGSLQFGRSSVKGDLQWQRLDGKTQVEARLAAELLAPAELRGLRDTPSSAPQRTLIDLPILPETLDFSDADLELTVKSVQGLTLDIAHLRFSGRMREGAMEPSPFSLQLQGSELTGTLALDSRGELPAARAVLEGNDFDAGSILRHLRLAEDVDARIGKLRLQAEVRGSRLGQVLEQSSLQASFEKGSLVYRDAGSQAALNLAVATGEMRVEPGGPVTGLITGSAGTLPAQLELKAGPLSDLLAPAGRWPFEISAALADAQWVISGATAAGPLPATELGFSLSGERLDDLNVLLATDMPPWGPYAFTGTLRFTRMTHQLEDVRIAIADSLLLGSGLLDTGSSPRRLEAVLRAPVIQLDDFLFGDWSPFPGSGQDPESGTASGPQPRGGNTTTVARRALASGVGSVHPLFSRERLALGNMDIEVRVEQLLAGAEELGQARIAASIIDGAATLGPIELDGRVGQAKAMITYEPRERDAVFSARAVVDRLDYGVLTRRFDPASGIGGVFSLDLAIDSVALELNQVMNTAGGHIDFAVWPDRLRWGGFDLWASNLMRSLLPFFSPASSRLNCVIGHFDLEQGLLASQALLVDTTHTRALGEARADFVTERLRMRFVPRHKSPRLVSLAIPVEVRGTFDDYRISLRPTDALGRVAQWFKTLVKIPLHWLGIGRIPSDGHDVCAEPARQ